MMMKFRVLLLTLLGSLMVPVGVNAQGTSDYIVIATKTGCKLYWGSPRPPKSADWSGSCREGFAQGFGTRTIRLFDGTVETWHVTMVRGMANGDGLVTTKHNGKLIGSLAGKWRNNEYVEGTRAEPGGATYSGTFENLLYHGHGTLAFANGDIFVGSFEYGLFSGYGVYTWASGHVYEGYWARGKRDGPGTQKGSDGRVTHSGIWREGSFYPSPNYTEAAKNVGVSSRSCAENGSCYGDISPLTGSPKTIHVDGYYRRDGTYVRGHYRSKGN